MIWIVVAYLVILFGVGIWANKFNNNVEDYLLAGRRLGIGLGSFTLVATYFGGGFVMGAGEFAYSDGMISWVSGLSGGVGLILVGFMAYRLRDLAIFTVPDYLSKRYNSSALRVFAALLSLVALIGILAAQVGAASRIFQVFGFDPITGGIVASVIFVVFTAIGGLWAATITDFIQVLIAVAGLLFATVAVFSAVGGWGGIVTALGAADIPSSFLSVLGQGDWSQLIYLFVPLVLYTLIGQDVYQRLLATKDPKTARNSCILAGIITCIITVFPVLMGIGGKVLYPDLVNAGLVIPTIITQLLPTFAAGLVVSAILAAIISTGDSILTAATSHIINDIYIHLFHHDKDVDQKKMLMLSRVVTLLVGAFAIVVSFLIPKIIDLLMMSYTLFTSGVFIPVVGGFIWKKATLPGAMCALFSGLAIAVANIAGVPFWGVPTEIFSALVSIVVFVVVSLLTQKSNKNGGSEIAA